MEQRKTSMGGNPITLLGQEPRVGTQAPDFIAVDQDFFPKSLSDFQDRIKLISVVPSLDTTVCDLQTRKFNELAVDFPENVTIIAISMDLPFAQKRWKASSGTERITTLSDHRDASFGESYGVLIEELRLLNRAIFLIDDTDIIRYIEIVEENYDHPDYEAAVAALQGQF